MPPARENDADAYATLLHSLSCRGAAARAPRSAHGRTVTRAIRATRAALAERPFIGALLLAFAWLLLVRGLVLTHSDIWPPAGRMLLADAVGALVLALLLSIMRTRWVRVPLVLLMGGVFYAAAQHMYVHGTSFRIAHAARIADPVFLRSSVASAWLLLLPAYCLLAFALHWLHERIDRRPPARPLRRLGAAVVCIAAYGVAVTSLTAPANNIVVATLAQVPGVVTSLRRPPATDEIEPLERDIQNTFFPRDVRGAPVDERPNVLIVVVESLSAAYLPSIARYHGLTPTISLPTLERALDERGFRTYRNILSMQRQTDRGSYPLLCGAYPHVGAATAQIAEVAGGGGDIVCVPDVLANAGYATGYLQAAPLEYMSKDTFMPRVGFERVLGADYFGEDTVGWGPADDVFFETAAGWLQELDAREDSWLAVTLNTGTHHPYPEGLAESGMPGAESTGGAARAGDGISGARPDRQAAFALMARELVSFLDTLEAANLLDDTLVMITSDESGAFLRGGEEARMLDGNFGMLAVRPHDELSLDDFSGRDSLVATLDLALTTLDAAGLADRADARKMVGRSLLVQQPSGTRGLLLGDTYAGYTVFLREAGDLLACGETLVRCSTWRFSPERLFGTLSEDDDASPFLEFGTRRQLIDQAAAIEQPAED